MFSDISFHILDILQNSLRADASEIIISIERKSAAHELYVSIKDNGKGMTAEQAENCCNPFYTTKINHCTGLGISFFKYAAEITGGRFSVKSVLSEGTMINAVFVMDSVNCIPLGNICSTIYSVLVSYPETRIILFMKAENICYKYDSEKLVLYYEKNGKVNYRMMYAETENLKRNIERLESKFVEYII